MRLVSAIFVVIGSAVGCGHGSHYERALTDIGLSVESRLIQRINLAKDLISDASPEFEAADGALLIAERALASGRPGAIDLADDAFSRCVSMTFELDRIIASIEDVGDPWSQTATRETAVLRSSYITTTSALQQTHRAMQSWVQAYEQRLSVTKASPGSPTPNNASLPTDAVRTEFEQARIQTDAFRRALRNAASSGVETGP